MKSNKTQMNRFNTKLAKKSQVLSIIHMSINLNIYYLKFFISCLIFMKECSFEEIKSKIIPQSF